MTGNNTQVGVEITLSEETSTRIKNISEMLNLNPQEVAQAFADYAVEMLARRRKDDRMVVVGVRVPTSLRDDIHELAKREGIKASQFLRIILEEAVYERSSKDKEAGL